MPNVDISIIIPSKNNRNKTAEIIKRIAKETSEISVEFIVIDMNSTDSSVLYSLNVIKNNDLRGCVIQSGAGPVSSALNTGIYKSNGKYISFVYPTRLYKNYLTGYLSQAEKTDADFVFSAPMYDSEKNAPEVPESFKGTDLAVDIMLSKLKIDFAAVLIRREFILKNYIRFNDECSFGYAEAFVLDLLMYNPKSSYSDVRPERDNINGLMKEESAINIKNCFERLEAILKVYDNAKKYHKNDTAFIRVFEYNKIPSIIISCIDFLSREGFGGSPINKLLKAKHYDTYLKSSSETPFLLKRKILVWNTAPWLYGKFLKK